MNSDPRKDRSIPLVFLITTIIAYGLLLPQTGFYWDDWPFVWIATFLEPADFFPAFANIRPFLGPIFFVTTSLIPPDPLYWQIFMIVIRFLSGLSVWFILKQIWPRYKREALAASFLFLVFPGYSQHWVAFTHINQEWIAFLFYLLSFGFTARALRNPHAFRTYTLLAILLLIPGVFPTEYFIGLEPLRFLFIWVIVSEGKGPFGRGIVESLKIWSPYLLVWLVNAAWLVYFYTIGSYASYEVKLASEPVTALQTLQAFGEALWEAGVYCWVQVIALVAKTYTAPSSILTLLLIGCSGLGLILYLKRFETSGNKSGSAAASMLAIGAVGILLGRLPSFSAGLPLTLQSVNDRFMISMMIGASLFITGLILILVRDERIKTVVFAALIALGIGQQFFNANIFRRDWENQQKFFWQLAWRIPAMQPGTLLLTDQLPVDYETDLSFTGAINWMYAPEYTRSTVPYALIYTETRLGGSLPSLERGETVKVFLRTVHFEGSTSQVIVFHMPENGCLRVLGSEWKDEFIYARQLGDLVDAIPLSNPDLIVADSELTPRLPFLSEPERTWCYYYTKSELARQRNDWDQVNALFAEASSLGYQSADPFEWLVFIEALAMAGDLEAAQKLSREAFETDRRIRSGLCEVWKRVQAGDPRVGELGPQMDQILADFWCPR